MKGLRSTRAAVGATSAVVKCLASIGGTELSSGTVGSGGTSGGLSSVEAVSVKRLGSSASGERK